MLGREKAIGVFAAERIPMSGRIKLMVLEDLFGGE